MFYVFLVGLAKLHCGASPPSVMVLYFQVVDTLEVLAECLAATPAARVHWTQAYTSNLGPSGQLLNYLGQMNSFQCLLIISTILRGCSFLTIYSPHPFYYSLPHTFILQTPTGSATARILTSQSCRRQLRLSRYFKLCSDD